MEEKKNIINKIKDLLKVEQFYNQESPKLESDITNESTETFETPEEVKVIEEEVVEEFQGKVEAKLVDGTEVIVMTKGETIAEGDKVMVKQGEEYVDAPNATHEVEGGMTITTEGGIITSVGTKVVEEEMGKDKEKEEMFESISLLTDLVTDLKKEINEIKNKNNELTENFKKFSSEPSVESIKKDTKKFSTTIDKNERLKFFGK